MNEVRIIALDPGPVQSAFVEWDGTAIHDATMLPNADLMQVLHSAEPPWEVYCEWITSFGMPVGEEVFETCYWVGRFESSVHEDVRFVRVPRRDIKHWHTGTPSSKDSNVIQALKDKYGDKGTKAKPGTTYRLKADLWQAFALAAYVTEKGSKP